MKCRPARPHLVDNICQTYVCLLDIWVYGLILFHYLCAPHVDVIGEKAWASLPMCDRSKTTSDVRAPCLLTQKIMNAPCLESLEVTSSQSTGAHCLGFEVKVHVPFASPSALLLAVAQTW